MSNLKWDDSADLVVIGFGAAGACTAIQAADAGAKVLILEKQPEEWHTPSTRASGGMITVVHDASKALPPLFSDPVPGTSIAVRQVPVWATAPPAAAANTASGPAHQIAAAPARTMMTRCRLIGSPQHVPAGALTRLAYLSPLPGPTR